MRTGFTAFDWVPFIFHSILRIIDWFYRVLPGFFVLPTVNSAFFFFIIRRVFVISMIFLTHSIMPGENRFHCFGLGWIGFRLDFIRFYGVFVWYWLVNEFN